MYKKTLLSIVLLTLSTLLAAKVEPENKHRAQLRLINSFLTNHHYQNSALDNDKSQEILDKYLSFLDFGKYLFTQDDINSFQQYNALMDDFVRKGELSIAFSMYNKFIDKRSRQIAWALQRLEKPFSEDAEGELELDREKVDWAENDEVLQQRWEKRLTNEWIVLRLAKQSDEKAREVLKKRYHNMTKRVNQPKPDEVFQLFVNAVTSVYDPHSNYFSPRTSESFDINMSLSLEGIGAQLTLEEEIITIKELIAGGPAQKSGKISPNDRILGVAQGASGAMEDVVGWRLDEAVTIIRGKRGTVVRLQIQQASNDEITEVTLVRDKINLEESAAQSEIKNLQIDGEDYRIGVIELPSFYIDFDAYNRGDDDYRSTTRDVKKLIKQLKEDNIDGLLIDLRDNGGGSLAEAVELTGLFVKQGPVVQVRRADGDLTVHTDDDGEVFYNGPLAVLINENSASASEIFAGAMKDYGRGVILGEPTFGKGTVQTIIDLSRFLPAVKDKVGQLKMTIAMFYRINGSSTQLKGVIPNIYIPNKDSYTPGGESEEDHALPWQSIDALEHQHLAGIDKVLNTLQSDYERDNKDNPLMKNLLAMTAWQNQQRQQTTVSLSLKKRLARQKDSREQSVKFANVFRKIYDYPLLTVDYLGKKDKEKSAEEKDNDEKYQVDAILKIATQTTADYVRLLRQ